MEAVPGSDTQGRRRPSRPQSRSAEFGRSRPPRSFRTPIRHAPPVTPPLPENDGSRQSVSLVLGRVPGSWPHKGQRRSSMHSGLEWDFGPSKGEAVSGPRAPIPRSFRPRRLRTIAPCAGPAGWPMNHNVVMGRMTWSRSEGGEAVAERKPIGCRVAPSSATSASTSPITLANLKPCPENLLRAAPVDGGVAVDDEVAVRRVRVQARRRCLDRARGAGHVAVQHRPQRLHLAVIDLPAHAARGAVTPPESRRPIFSPSPGATRKPPGHPPDGREATGTTWNLKELRTHRL